MKLFLIISLVVSICLIGITCQNYPALDEVNSTEDTDNNTFDVAGSISTLLVETLSQKVQTLIEIFNVKLRLIQFVRSLYTTENLQLLRKLLSLGVRFGKWILNFIPTSANTDGSLLLNILFPQINLGLGSLFGGSNTDSNSNSGSSATSTYSSALSDKNGPSSTSTVSATSYGIPSTHNGNTFRSSRDVTEEDKMLVKQAVSLHDLIAAGDKK